MKKTTNEQQQKKPFQKTAFCRRSDCFHNTKKMRKKFVVRRKVHLAFCKVSPSPLYPVYSLHRAVCGCYSSTHTFILTLAIQSVLRDPTKIESLSSNKCRALDLYIIEILLLLRFVEISKEVFHIDNEPKMSAKIIIDRCHLSIHSPAHTEPICCTISKQMCKVPICANKCRGWEGHRAA